MEEREMGEAGGKKWSGVPHIQKPQQTVSMQQKAKKLNVRTALGGKSRGLGLGQPLYRKANSTALATMTAEMMFAENSEDLRQAPREMRNTALDDIVTPKHDDSTMTNRSRPKADFTTVEAGDHDRPIPLANGDARTNVKLSQLNAGTASKSKSKVLQERHVSCQPETASKPKPQMRKKPSAYKENSPEAFEPTDEASPRANCVFSFQAFKGCK